MAACRLASSGLRVVILEKSTLPRPKPCGGAMPLAVTEMLDWDITDLVERRISLVRNQFDHAQDRQTATRAPILMVSRPRFDQHLIDLVNSGLITMETAIYASSNPEEFERSLRVE